MEKTEKDNRPIIVTIHCLVYNHKSYIRQCLEGFVMQKTNFKFEVIVHDDASTDGTVSIIREYAENYPDIIKPIYETENQYSKHDGSLKRIMDAHIRGKYVALCEGDDYWIYPLKLQTQFDFMESNPEYVMCCHNAFIDHYTPNRHYASIFTDLNIDCDLDDEHAIGKWSVPTASMFIKREEFLKPNWLCPIYSEDFSLILRLYHVGKIRCLNRIMSVYRHQTYGNSSASANTNWIFIAEQQLKLLEDYNKKTKGQYSNIIGRKIKEKKDFLSYEKVKERYSVLTIFVFPYKYSRQIIGSMLRKIGPISNRE